MQNLKTQVALDVKRIALFSRWDTNNGYTKSGRP